MRKKIQERSIVKVAVICDVLGQANNGTTIAALNLIRTLREKRHEVRVVCPDAERAGEPGYYIVPKYDFHMFNDYVEKNGITAATGGWAKDSISTELGRLPITWSGASNTYLTAYFYIDPTIVAVAIVGGSASSGAKCGFGVCLNNSVSSANWNIAPGLSCKMPLAA